MTYVGVLEFLYGALPVFQHQGVGAYKPGLERAAAFNDLLGRPDRAFAAIHVAGTNGKGSVSHMLASVLHAAGCRTGLYTSPHLRDFRERIRVDGEPIPEREVVSFVERHREAMVARELSFFEMTVGMAFDWFARQDVGVAVVETGLGGRLDATNILRPVLSVITNVGFDHMSLLGDTIPRIAAEKAGIIKPGVPVVVGERNPASAPVFRAVAAERGAPIRFAETMFRAVPEGEDDTDEHSVGTARTFRIERLGDGGSFLPGVGAFPLRVDLAGDYQRHNVATALAALQVLHGTAAAAGIALPPLDRAAVDEGFRHAAASTGLLGRWQVLGRSPLAVADTGHNEDGIRQVAAQIARQRYRKLYVILGVVNDKDLSAILPLLPRDARYIFTQASVARALPADRLAAEAAGYGLHGEVVPGVPAAWARARELAGPQDMIFVGGSTFTVADLPDTADPTRSRSPRRHIP